MPAERPQARGALQAANLPLALRAELLPALENLVQRHQPEGLWLFGSWARGTASRRSDVDLLVMGLGDQRLLDACDAVLEPCRTAACPSSLCWPARPCWRRTAIPPSGVR